MAVVNTNISAMVGLNNVRLTNLGLQKSLERLSSGLRINVAADDPSGLAIGVGMESQINGLRVAVQNAEDGVSLIHTADGVLSETQDILLRMRDLILKASNEAVLTTSDQRMLSTEFVSLKRELQRKGQAVTFNQKTLFTGSAFGSAAFGLLLQIGADNGANYRMTVVIATMTLTGLSLAGAAAAFSFAAGWSIGSVKANASRALSFLALVDTALNTVSDTRASLGIIERRLDHVINDLMAQDINVSAAKSRIIDADMAAEISDFTRLQILQQSGVAVLAQANAQPQSILQLLT